MDVLAYLPRPLLAHLRVVLGAAHSLLVAESWADLETLVQHQSGQLLVVDPAASGQTHIARVLTLRERYPSLPVVVYTVLRRDSMPSIVQLARRGVEHVVLYRFDDDPRAFRELLEQVPAQGLAERMVAMLEGPLAALPPVVRAVVEELFRCPLRFRSAQDLATAAGMTTRTLYRNLQPAGFRSPRMLVICARLLRAYSDLQDPGRSIKDVAAKVGYNSPALLSRQMYEVGGITMGVVRQGAATSEFVARLAAEARGGPAGVT